MWLPVTISEGMARAKPWPASAGGHLPAIVHHAAHVDDRRGAGGHDAGRGRAQVSGYGHGHARPELADRGHVLQESAGVEEADPVRHRGDQSARTARAKGNAALRHHVSH
jgi:hypothetical protein